MVEPQARDLEVRISNPGPGGIFLMNVNCISQATNYPRKFVFTCQFHLKLHLWSCIKSAY